MGFLANVQRGETLQGERKMVLDGYKLQESLSHALHPGVTYIM